MYVAAVVVQVCKQRRLGTWQYVYMVTRGLLLWDGVELGIGPISPPCFPNDCHNRRRESWYVSLCLVFLACGVVLSVFSCVVWFLYKSSDWLEVT